MNNIVEDCINIKNIGIDVDGPLANLQAYQFEKGIPYFSKLKGVSESEVVVDPNAYDVKEIFGVTKEERDKFWKKYIWEYCLLLKPDKETVEKIQKWHKQGKKIYIITSRVYVDERSFLGLLFRTMLTYWLKTNDIPYDDIVYCSEKESYIDKAKACEELDISIMIDDMVCNVKEISKSRVTACYDANWNQDYEAKYRVKDFNEADKLIQIIDAKFQEEMSKFKRLGPKKLDSLTSEQRLTYYKELRQYISSLPYDEKQVKTDELKYKIASNIIIPIFSAIFNPKVIDSQFVPQKKEGIGRIFVSNHLGSLDQFPIIKALGKNNPVHFMTSSTLLKLKRGKLYKNIGCIIVDLNSIKSMVAAQEQAAKIVLAGGDVFYFAEGTRNTTDKFMLEFKLGPVSLAKDTGAVIYPCTVNDSYNFRSKHLYTRFSSEPIIVSPDDDLLEANTKLFCSIADLVYENMFLEQAERGNTNSKEFKQKLIRRHEKKRLKLMKQREKINRN